MEINEIVSLEGHSSYVLDVSWSPDDSMLASASWDGTINIWETGNWTRVQNLTDHRISVLTVEWSPDMRYLASGSNDDTIRIWDTKNWKVKKVIKGHPSGAMAWSPNGSYLASYWGFNSTTFMVIVAVWDTSTWELIVEKQAHNKSIQDLLWIENGNILISASHDGTIKLWNTTDWSCIRSFSHGEPIVDIDYHSGMLISSSKYHSVKLWNVTTGLEVKSFYVYGSYYTDQLFLSWNPLGDVLATGSKTIMIWETKNWTMMQNLTSHSSPMDSLEWSHSGFFLASGSFDATIKIWAIDRDGDRIQDSDDDFIHDPTQHIDSDGDGYGDNISGNNPDIFPNDPNEWNDTDGDDIGDNSDVFPLDPTQWIDTDSDGYGDNQYGYNPDRFPDDPNEWNDTDGDGIGDNSDTFPLDPNEWNDSDRDGVGDNTDSFPNDPTQQIDTDGDGFGDNLTGNNPDFFPSDPLEWIDTDNDTFGDHSDTFPTDPSASIDTDNDGSPDSWNPNMNESNSTTDLHLDAFPTDPASSIDTDGDGMPDEWNPGMGPENTTSDPPLEIDPYPNDPLNIPPDEENGAEPSRLSKTGIVVVTILAIVILFSIFIIILSGKKKRPPDRKEDDHGRVEPTPRNVRKLQTWRRRY